MPSRISLRTGSCWLPTVQEQTVAIAEIEHDIGLERLKAAVESNQKLQAPAEAQRNDKLHEQISWLQKTAGRILRSVPLCAHDQDRALLDALEFVRSYPEASTIADAPLEAVAPRFRGWALDERGRPVGARCVGFRRLVVGSASRTLKEVLCRRFLD